MRRVRYLIVFLLILVTVVLVVAQDDASDEVILVRLDDQTVTANAFVKQFHLTRALHYLTIQMEYEAIESLGFNDKQITDILTSQSPYAEIIQVLTYPDLLGNEVLETMIEDLIIQQQADLWQIDISQDQYNRAIYAYLSFDPQAVFADAIPTPVPSPIATDPYTEPTVTVTPADANAQATIIPTASPTLVPTQTMNERYDAFSDDVVRMYDFMVQQPGISDADIYVYFEQLARREAVKSIVTADITPLQVHVNSRHILVQTEAEALSIIDALQNGADFAEQAQEFSEDTGSAARGGELGWTAASNFVKPYADAVRTGPIGEVFGPVETQFGFHVIEVLGREDRYVGEDQLDRLKQYAFDEWLEAQRDAADVEINNAWVDYVPEE